MFVLLSCLVIIYFFFWFVKAIAVSRDHKPDQSDERQRIEDAGGFVMWAGEKTFNENLTSYMLLYVYLIGVVLKGTWRVGGVLAVSRAFGDRLLKQYVVADPEIQVLALHHNLFHR